MHTRLFYGAIQPGKSDEAWQVLIEFARRVKQLKGCLLMQLLQSGNEIVAITNWATQEDLTAYAEGQVSRELFQRITPLFLGMPVVRTYAVRFNQCDEGMLKAI
jgi:quinol monooxygenase YgiN